MTSGDWLYWVGWAGVIAVNVAMVYLAWWALFSDRSKGRRRCPRCWYDMSYSPGMICAECGFTAKREKQLLRTRRRWAHAMLAILTCVVLAWFVNQRMGRTGWVSLLPTRVIILSLPLANDPSGPLFSELGRRMFSRQLSDGQWAMLVERCVEGDWWARPPGDPWADKYGVLLSRWRDSFIPSRDERDGNPDTREYSDLERMMMDVPPRIEMNAREIWPEGAQPQAQLRVYDWWPRGTNIRVTLTPRVEGEQPLTLYRRNTRELRAAASVALPGTADDGRPVTFDITVARHAPDFDDDWTDILETSRTVKIRREGTMPAQFSPTNDDQITDVMKEIFEGRVVAWTDGRSPVRFQYSPGRSYGSMFDDVAIGIALELRHEDRLARVLHIWWLGGTGASGTVPADRGLGWEIAHEDEELLRTIHDGASGWTMRVRGDASLALRAGEAAKYWNGSFEIPARISRHSRRAPPPEWWAEPAAESGLTSPPRDVDAEVPSDPE